MCTAFDPVLLHGDEASVGNLCYASVRPTAVADRLLHEIGVSHPEPAASAYFARGYLCAATKRDLPGLGRLWKLFSSMERS
jgi:hypothetical protein